MEVLDPYMTFDDDFELGVPLPKQPRVRLLDINKNPVIGKRVFYLTLQQVQAFTWFAPAFQSPDTWGVEYYIYKGKLGVLEGDSSEPSDENGVAAFKYVCLIFQKPDCNGLDI